ncbi:hypothetical protein AC1031_002738 [Aphanomyces cochlioides]|nr:hypothetical protein AC1031_002738 [Aphanomyces cochlioides]
MQGNGMYNNAAACQVAVVDLTAEFLKSAMERFVKHATPKASYCIADFGASQGQKSVQLIHHVLGHLQSSLPSDPHREFFVIHEDQPANDFACLPKTLHSSASYIHARPNVYCGAIKSFYERLMPTASVDVVVSYIAAHWLSKLPAPLPGPMIFFEDPERHASLPPTIVAAWRQAGHNDLVNFLHLRAAELVDHGALCFTISSDDGTERCRLFLHVGLVSAETLERMAIPSMLRSTEDVLAAFANVPELELHKYEHFVVEYPFENPADAAALMLSVQKPSYEAAMTEEERADPRVHEALMTCMTKRMGQVIGDYTKPYCHHVGGSFFFAHCTRRPRK